MKKKYINPEIKVVKIAMQQMIAASPDGEKVSEEKLDSGIDGLARENSFFWEPESLEEE